MLRVISFISCHVWWSLTGFLRLLVHQPFWAIKLFFVRFLFFVTRRFFGPVTTPDNYIIESSNELISYWSFFVEQECRDEGLMSELAATRRPVIVDVGANAGMFTHWIWSQKPEAQFIIFEPQPKMVQKIQTTSKRTGALITIHQKGVSDQIGTAVFYSSSDNDTTASLCPEGPKSVKTTIPIVSLDSTVPDQDIFLLKIDVEGAECEALQGAAHVLFRTRFLLVEAHTQQALDKIHATLGNQWHAKQVGTSDYLLTKKPLTRKA